ncbi:MAG: hypothetical protein ABIR71_05615 [Chthoniobacterales bacterium]
MKRFPILAALLLATLVQANPAEPTAASEQQLLTAIRELQTQQAAIADNQTKIDEKIAGVIEAVRVARIYSSRSGK